MKSNDPVIANIIADSQETTQHQEALDRRQFLTRLAAGVGGIGGALSSLRICAVKEWTTTNAYHTSSPSHTGC